MSTQLNQRQKGLLPSKVQNPKNKGQYMAVTTKGCKSTIDPPMPVEVEDVREKIVAHNDVVEENDCVKDGVSKAAQAPQKYNPIPTPPPPIC